MAKLRSLAPRMRTLSPSVRPIRKVVERFYASAAWKAYRQQHRQWTIAQHGGVWCITCGAGGRLILDHRVERKDGGEDFPPYDQADWYCTACHNRKTAQARAQRATGS